MYPRSGFSYLGTSECTLVPVFGTWEHPPKLPFWRPPFCEPPIRIQIFELFLRKRKLQNESSPNFSNFRPEFCPGFCSEFSPNFSRIFRASFRGRRRPEKIHQKSPPFFNGKIPGKHEKNIHKILLESRQSIFFFCSSQFSARGKDQDFYILHSLTSDGSSLHCSADLLRSLHLANSRARFGVSRWSPFNEISSVGGFEKGFLRIFPLFLRIFPLFLRTGNFTPPRLHRPRAELPEKRPLYEGARGTPFCGRRQKT